MKRVAAAGAIFVLCIALFPSTASAAATYCLPPRCRDITVPLPAGVSVPDPVARVLLPPGYDAQRAGGYPVIYLLHAAGEDHRAWTSNVDLDMLAAGAQVIFVMPAGGGVGSVHGWYSDWTDGSAQWETFHTEVLPAYIDQRFNTSPTDRAIAGVSSGGFGAMSYAARHPGTYTAAASLSGITDTWMEGVGANMMYATSAVDGAVWGSPNTPGGMANWRAHNPTDLAALFKGIDVFLTSGEVETDTEVSVDTCDFEIGLYRWCDAESHAALARGRFTNQLERSGASFQQWVLDHGTHDWTSWELAARWAIPKLIESLAG